MDDDPSVVSYISSIAKSLGYRIEAAKDGTEAVWLYELDPRIDALITDIRMPGMDGFELAKTLRAKRPDLPILIISGYFDKDSGAAGKTFESYGKHYLAKPFSRERLIESLRTLLDDLNDRPGSDAHALPGTQEASNT